MRSKASSGLSPWIWAHDAAVARRLELLGEQLPVSDRAFLQQTDGGDVGQTLDDARVDVGQRACFPAEEVESTHDLAAQPQGEGMH